jgi:CHAT domain-containing protein
VIIMMMVPMRRRAVGMAFGLALVAANVTGAVAQPAVITAPELWRVFAELRSAAELGDTLVKTDAGARDALLAEHADRLSPMLVRALVQTCREVMVQGKNTKALDVCGLAQRVAVQIGDTRGEGQALNATGAAYETQDDLPVALEYYQRALEVRERAGDERGMGATLSNMGIAFERQGLFAEAFDHYERSAAISRRLDDSFTLASTLNNLGLAYYRQGDYARALEHYRESTAIFERESNRSALLRTSENMAMLHHAQGDHAQAAEMYLKVLAAHEAAKNTSGVARTLTNLSQLRSTEGRHDEAFAHLQRALALRESLDDRSGVAGTLNTLGIAYEEAGDYARAIEYYERALVIRQALGMMGAVASTLRDLAMAQEKRQAWQPALEAADRAAAAARPLGALEALWRVRLVAGQSHRRLGRPDEARAAFEEAIAIVETLRGRVAGGERDRQRSFESKLRPYHALVDLFVETDKPLDALMMAERARARVLLEVLANGRAEVTKSMTAEEQEQERALTSVLTSANAQMLRLRANAATPAARITEATQRLDRARLDLEAFHTTLYAAHPELRAQRGEAPPLTTSDLRSLLRADVGAALIEFVVTSEATYLFLVRACAPTDSAPPDAAPCVTAKRLAVSEETLTSRVGQFRGMLASQDTRFSTSARGLYDLLLAPIATSLRGVRTLVVAPDGPLWELPMQALQTPSGRFAIDDYVIAYTPSLTVLREMMALRDRRPVTRHANTLLAFGNPALGGGAPAAKATSTPASAPTTDARIMASPLANLPDAERQVHSLQTIYGARNSKIYIGAAADEGRFKAEAARYRVLHLATHGMLDDRNPMYSHLRLARRTSSSTEDGLLEAWELMQLPLNADVAVLSACETARGRVGRGEGMIGLTWALFVAGVPTTVVSQWQVRSDSTAELMIGLHRELRRAGARSPHTGTAAALRLAALAVKNDSRYRHPFHWAPFVVMGDGF